MDVVCVHTPHDNGRESTARPAQSDASPADTVSTAEHCSCGILGFIAAVGAVALSYPMLLTQTDSLHLLSSTAVVAVLVATWLGVWLLLEVTWEWWSSDGTPGR